MQFQSLLNREEDRAVSPVIGVILMVAITVILAAVIGTFVLGLGDQVQETAPNSQFTFDWDNNHQTDGSDELEVTHDGGDGIANDELAIRASGAQNYADGTDTYTDVEQGTADADIYLFEQETVRAGASATLGEDDFDSVSERLALNGTTVRVVWEDADSDRSSTIRTWTGPDA